MKQKEVSRLQKEYEKRGLVQDPELIMEVQRALKGVPNELPKTRLQEMLRYLRVHPLIEELDIYMHAVEHSTISDKDLQRLKQLERNYQSLTKNKPYQQIMAADIESDNRRVVRFNPHVSNRKELEWILIQNGVCCMDKRQLDDIVENFFVDSLLGGSVIATLEKKNRGRSLMNYKKGNPKDKNDNPILAVGRFFVGRDHEGVPVLSADMYSHGDYQTRYLMQWLDVGKPYYFSYGPATMLYLAERLNIHRLVFCDLEMAEFAKQVGLKRKQVFNPIQEGKFGARYDNRKSGIITVVDNSKGVWNHQHSVYHESSGRHFVLDYEPLTMEILYNKFNSLLVTINIEVGQLPEKSLKAPQHKSMRIQEKFTAMYTLLRIMEDAYLNNRKFEDSKILYNKAIDLVRSRNQSFSLPYAK